MKCPHIGDHRMTQIHCMAAVLCSQILRNASLIQMMTEETERDGNIFAAVTSGLGQPLLKINGKKGNYKLKDHWISSKSWSWNTLVKRISYAISLRPIEGFPHVNVSLFRWHLAPMQFRHMVALRFLYLESSNQLCLVSRSQSRLCLLLKLGTHHVMRSDMDL